MDYEEKREGLKETFKAFAAMAPDKESREKMKRFTASKAFNACIDDLLLFISRTEEEGKLIYDALEEKRKNIPPIEDLTGVVRNFPQEQYIEIVLATALARRVMSVSNEDKTQAMNRVLAFTGTLSGLINKMFDN